MSVLLAQLSHLESAGLVSLSTVEPDLTYAFRHPLMQEVAYGSLTREDRKNLHRTIASTLETTYPDRLEELAPVLADHFDLAGDRSQASHYYRIAANAAERVYANPEAVRYYRRALKLVLEQNDRPLDDPLLVEVCGRLGRVMELAGMHVEALGHYQEMENLARQRQNRRLELAALLARITLISTPTFVLDPDQARDLSRRALELAHELQDLPAEAKIYWNLLLANYFSNDIPMANAYGEQSLELARKLNLREQLAYTLNDLGSYVYSSQGDFTRSLDALSEAQMIWREINNLPMLSDNLNNSATIYFIQGKFDQAAQLADEAYQISKTIGNRWGQVYSRGVYSFIYSQIGWGERTLEYLDEAIRTGQESGFAGVVIICYTLKGFLYATLGAADEGMAYVQEAIRVGGEISNFWIDQAYGCQALLYIQQGKTAEAEEALQQSQKAFHDLEQYLMTSMVTTAQCLFYLEKGDYQRLLDFSATSENLLRAHGVWAYLSEVLFYKAKALLGLGRIVEAREVLAEADRAASALNIYRVRWMILGALAQIELERGDRDAGRAYFQQARQVVAWMADHAGNEALRGSFLRMEAVRRLEELEI